MDPVLNIVSHSFTALAGNNPIKVRAIKSPQKYGVGGCGPLGLLVRPCVTNCRAERFCYAVYVRT